MDQPDNRLALGQGGLGKSSLVWEWIGKYRGRVLIFDPNAEPQYAEGAVIVRTKGDMVRAVTGKTPKNLRVCFRGVSPRRGRYEGDFEVFNRVARALENCLVVWEEVDSWFKSREVSPVAFELVNQGRHRDITVIGVSRRPAMVARDMTANATQIACFGTEEPRDLNYLAEYIGKDVAAQLKGLTPHHAILWNRAPRWTKKITTKPLPKKSS